MKKRILFIIFLVGFIFSLAIHWIAIPNAYNPLLSSQTLYEKIIIWYYTRSLQPCLKKIDQRQMFNCTNAQLRTISKKYGARVALDVIEPISQRQPILLGYGHELSHTIGNNAIYASYGIGSGLLSVNETKLVQKIGKVIIDCDGWGSFGCYHGVIEVALSRIDPKKRTAIVKEACLNNPLVMKKQYYINQCMHWFGHAMAIFTDQTLEQTLYECESVSKDPNSDEVQLCLSGVFHAGAAPGTTDADYLQNISRVYDPKDVYFPCRTVAERFRGHCFSHIMGRSHTSDIPTIMRNCDNIPEKDPEKLKIYTQGCYESLGNNLLINGNFTAEGVAKQCDASAVPEHLGFCYGGAARYSILRDPLLNNDLPFRICQLVKIPSQKRTCFSLVGFANYENYKSKDVLHQYCAKSEAPYQKDCESWAPELQ